MFIARFFVVIDFPKNPLTLAPERQAVFMISLIFILSQDAVASILLLCVCLFIVFFVILFIMLLKIAFRSDKKLTRYEVLENNF